jgi:hypothetical protein
MMFWRLFFDFFLEKIKKQAPKQNIFLFQGSPMELSHNSIKQCWGVCFLDLFRKNQKTGAKTKYYQGS